MSLADLDLLSTLHISEQLELVGPSGPASLDGDPQALVAELIAEARLLWRIRQLAEISPNARASSVIRWAGQTVAPLARSLP